MKNNFPITPNQPDVKSVMQNNGLWFMNENLEKGMTCVLSCKFRNAAEKIIRS